MDGDTVQTARRRLQQATQNGDSVTEMDQDDMGIEGQGDGEESEDTDAIQDTDNAAVDFRNGWVYFKVADSFACTKVLELLMENINFASGEPLTLGFFLFFTHSADAMKAETETVQVESGVRNEMNLADEGDRDDETTHGTIEGEENHEDSGNSNAGSGDRAMDRGDSVGSESESDEGEQSNYGALEPDGKCTEENVTAVDDELYPNVSLDREAISSEKDSSVSHRSGSGEDGVWDTWSRKYLETLYATADGNPETFETEYDRKIKAIDLLMEESEKLHKHFSVTLKQVSQCAHNGTHHRLFTCALCSDNVERGANKLEQQNNTAALLMCEIII